MQKPPEGGFAPDRRSNRGDMQVMWLTTGRRASSPALIEQRQVDRVAHRAIAAVARVQPVAAIELGPHLGRDFRVAQRRVEIADAVEDAALANPPVTATRCVSRVGFQALAMKVSLPNGVRVAPKIRMPRACALSAIWCSPAIICAAVTSSSGLA